MGIIENLAKNPAVLGIAALGVILLVFNKQISQFFSDITGGAKGTASIAETGGILARNFQSFLTATPLPEDPIFGEQGFFANLSKSITDFKFPSFEFPTFGQPIVSDPRSLNQRLEEPFPISFTDVGMAEARARQTPETIEEIFPDQPVSISDFIKRFTEPTPQDFGVTVAPALLDETQGFIGAGVSFEGGTIFETPIENLSLSQIINKFMVTASQAANIRAQAIGFTPEEQAFLNQGQEISPLGDIASQPAVSDPQFAGLTPEQIALRLTGGNISNF